MRPLHKEFVRQLFQWLGFRITRDRPTNRYQAIDETLLLMRDRGYRPRVVIDGGANMGVWTTMARKVFPDAAYHLIEPQPACAAELRRLVERTPGLHLHSVALSRPGVEQVRMIGGGPDGGGTGAWVAEPGETIPGDKEYEVPAVTLDGLLESRVTQADRALLKMDMEGHEMTALQGGERLLGVVEVILSEVSFFDINHRGRPLFSDFLAFLRQRGFELYDFTALSGRPRDLRLRQGDVVFVRQDSPLLTDCSWE